LHVTRAPDILTDIVEIGGTGAAKTTPPTPLSSMTHHTQHGKKSALEKIADYENQKPANLWLHVKPAHLAGQLKKLVEDPDRIKQQNSSWCGPAAFLNSFARDAPALYVKLVLDLVVHGRADLHRGHHPGVSLHPVKDILTYNFHKTKIEDADWVPLASLRDSLRPSHKHFNDKWLKKGTYPEDIQRYYHETGYREIHNLTSDTSLNGPHAIRFASYANEFLHKHYRVTKRIQADILHYNRSAGSDNPQGWKDPRHNHWVDLVKPIQWLGPKEDLKTVVSFNVFSWGRRNFQVNVTAGDFYNHYFGFVCAKY
jgi:hypothetical protein